jgi:indolepyruvate ferredoxin oxidoreductase alpha subunit
MTRPQKSHAEGRVIQIVTGLGVDPAHIRVINPVRKNHTRNLLTIINEELDTIKVLSVIIPQRECMQTLSKKTKEAKK